MRPPRELLLQLARLAGADAFAERFGPPQTADPPPDALAVLIDDRLEEIARALVEEAAASDDVIDAAGAHAYLDDRLRTLAELLTAEQTARIRAAFQQRIAAW